MKPFKHNQLLVSSYKFYLIFLLLSITSSPFLSQSRKNNLVISDIEGNTYSTLSIGTQQWMAENLKTRKYNDGSPIDNITDEGEWALNTTGAWCYYDNNQANNVRYGKLYNWYVVNNRNICPTGWHVPSKEDWNILLDYLGGGKAAVLKMTEKKNNTLSFNALFGGCRSFNGYYYGSIGQFGAWWSSSESSSENAWGVTLDKTNGTVYLNESNATTNGASIRCIKD